MSPLLKSVQHRDNCEWNPQGLRPCKSGTWAGGRGSVIHLQKETGIEKEQIRVAMEEEEHLRHTAVNFHQDIWRRILFTPGSPSHGSVKCELLQPKTGYSQVYSTSARTYGHNTVYSKYTSAWNVAVSTVSTDWSSPQEIIHVSKMSFGTHWRAVSEETARVG